MPTILFALGWRLFFYSNEGTEPMHVHARKGDMEAKYWIIEDRFDIDEAWAHDMTPAARRELRRLVFDHFDLICAAWKEHFGA